MSIPREATVPAVKCECGHWAKYGEITTCRFCDCERHCPTQLPYGGHDPGTPPGAETALQSFSDALEPARIAVEDARNAEVLAKGVRDKARRWWLLSDECPRVARDAYTVAYRDAWVDSRIETEQDAYDAAKLARQAAVEHLKTLREQGIIQMGIAKSVSQTYIGGDRRWSA